MVKVHFNQYDILLYGIKPLILVRLPVWNICLK